MNSSFKGRTGLDRILHAAINSRDGFVAAVRHESAVRQEVLAAAVLLPAAWWLARDWREAALLAGSVVLVIIVELLNSAVEAVVDRVSLDWHELSKRAKDYGSAAVLLSLLLCGGIWAAAIIDRCRA